MQGRRRPEGAGRIVGLPMNGSYSTPTQYYRGLGTDFSLPMVTERHVNDFECMFAAQEGQHSQISFLRGVFHVPQLLCVQSHDEAFIPESVLIVEFSCYSVMKSLSLYDILQTPVSKTKGFMGNTDSSSNKSILYICIRQEFRV